MLTAEKLREVLHYDPETGTFTWKVARGGKKPGDEAGLIQPNGRRYIRIDRRGYLAHRLAWLYSNGAWPIDQIDHINGSKHDNRLSNLREANNAQNSQNKKNAHANNACGHLGVHKCGGKWRAQIRLNGKLKHIGLFASPSEASAAYLAAKAELHPFSAGTCSRS